MGREHIDNQAVARIELSPVGGPDRLSGKLNTGMVDHRERGEDHFLIDLSDIVGQQHMLTAA